MDGLSIVGLLIAFMAILVGNGLEGGSVMELVNGPAFVIVFGGTLGATLLQTSWPVLRNAMDILPWLIKPPESTIKKTVQTIIAWSEIARREGLLGLENLAETEKDPLARHGLWLLVDGYDTHQIRHILTQEVIAIENGGVRAAKVYEAMGGYAPTIGIIGAVLGLIQVMYNLTDPALLGPGIATAFVATIYGVGFSNLVFLPIAEKLKSVIFDRAIQNDVLVEGMIALAEGDNPRMIRIRLSGFTSGVRSL